MHECDDPETRAEGTGRALPAAGRDRVGRDTAVTPLRRDVATARSGLARPCDARIARQYRPSAHFAKDWRTAAARAAGTDPAAGSGG